MTFCSKAELGFSGAHIVGLRVQPNLTCFDKPGGFKPRHIEESATDADGLKLTGPQSQIGFRGRLGFVRRSYRQRFAKLENVATSTQ